MSKSRINTGGPAFPIECYITGGIMDTKGMEVRTYLAAKAIAGIIAAEGEVRTPSRQVAKRAYEIADAMLEIEQETSQRNAEIDRAERDLDRPF